MATKKTTTASKKATGKSTADEASLNGTAEAKAPKAAAKKAAAPKAASANGASSNGVGSHGGEKAAPSHGEIAHLAHKYWEERGRHHGSHVSDWVRAEQELARR